MTFCKSLIASVIVLAVSSPAAKADLYWDSNGANPGGSDTDTAIGTWGTSNFWSTDPDGNAATGAWAPDETAVFSAGSNVTGTYNVTLGGTQSASGIRFEEGAVTITGGTSLTLTGAAGIALQNSTTATIASPIGGSAAAGTTGLSLSGPGTLIVSGANTYTGNTLIVDNATGPATTLRLGASNVLPDTSVLQIQGKNDVIDLNGFSDTVKSIASINTGTAATQNSHIDVGTSTLTLNDAAGEVEVYQAGLFSQSTGKIVKTGAGELDINSSNTSWNGEFVLSGGTLGIGANNMLGSNGGNNSNAKLTLNGGTLTFSGTGSRSLQTENVDITNSFSALMGASNVELIGFTVAGEGDAVTTLKTANPTITVSNTTGTTGTFIFRGPVGDGGNNYGFTKAGPGVLTLNNPNSTYGGNTVVMAGQLRIDDNATLGNGSGTLVLAGGTLDTTLSRDPSVNPIPNPVSVTGNSSITTNRATVDSTVNVNFTSNSVGGTAGTLTLQNIATSSIASQFEVQFSGSGFDFGRPIVIAAGLNNANRTARLNSGNASGTQTFSGAISGPGSYRRMAGGTTVFTGANTFTGDTTVEGGTLTASGSAATLGGGNVTNTGGVLTISSGVTNAIANTATLSLMGGGTPNLADVGYLALGTGINEQVAALMLGGFAQANGTYGSSTSSATFKLNEYFSGAGIITVGSAVTGVAGDYNGNGVVDAADYVLWRNGGPLQNEVNSIGTVDASDYTAWRARFGNTSGSGSSLSAGAAVPEPGSCSLLVLGIGSVWAIGMSRRKIARRPV
ncbi:MAG TPA: autotransporter-associated beta strand repeat-containing protein [Lacipirellulaceae bacterium]|nr:autotransporter-associated beta strand repeat-containing protein [Lacipirellulaceae bacterium]